MAYELSPLSSRPATIGRGCRLTGGRALLSQELELKPIFAEELEPIVLLGAPVVGTKAEAARRLAERLDDVRLAVALLQGSAEKVIEIAERQPLLLAIIESCAALEDRLASIPTVAVARA